MKDPAPDADRSSARPSQAEEARHLASVLAIVAEAVVSVDEAQQIIFFNQGAEKIFGYEAGQVLGRPLDVLLPERYREAHRRHVDAFARSSVTSAGWASGWRSGRSEATVRSFRPRRPSPGRRRTVGPC
jgi:PAS domain-containing protein